MFPVEFNLSDLLASNGGDGSEGFILYGINELDRLGESVSSAGDINGDGFDDIIFGTRYGKGDNNTTNLSGESYVVFGGTSFNAETNLSDIVSGDGSNGFVLYGIDEFDLLGQSVSNVGDVNGDGIDDIIISATGGDSNNNTIGSSGESYIVFGDSSFGAEVNLSDLLSENGGDGSNGFVLYGVDQNDQSGNATSSAGDVNGDGIDDIIIGARRGSGYNNAKDRPGESYVVFGGTSFDAEINLSDIVNGDGSNGFVLHGIDATDYSGISVNSAGDINGDGFDDIIIGAKFGDGKDNNAYQSGESYVVFGGTSFDAEIDLSDIVNGDGSNGFVLHGIDTLDLLGESVSSAGDFNNDGIDDIIIGASGADPNGNDSAGEAYVVFGSTSFDAEVNLSDLLSENGGDGSNGFILNGISDLGDPVSSAGDVNGDGIDDIILGGEFTANRRYVIYGGSPISAELNISDIVNGDGSQGFSFRISGNDLTKSDVSSAGDVNGDGIDDIILGARNGDGAEDTTNLSGDIYVVFGKADDASIIDSTPSGNNNLSGTSSADRIESGAGDDTTRGGAGNDEVDGDNGNDRLFGDAGADELDGGNNDDFIQGGDDGDTIKGSKGDDVLYGDAGNDALTGGAGKDVLVGGAGDDLLDGGTAADRLLGGADADTFVIRPGDLNNVIYDFEDNTDSISLVAGLEFNDLTITDNGSNTGTNITSSGDLLVTLVGIDEANITAADF